MPTTTLSTEKAKALAERLWSCSIEIKNLQEMKKNLESDLRKYVEESGEKDLGILIAYERAKPAKLVGAEGKRLEAMTEEVMNHFPDYVTRKLNITDVAKNIETDVALAGFLENLGLGIEQEVDIYFKSK